MARKLTVVRTIKIVSVSRLSPPPEAPASHPLLWLEEGVGKHPPIVRWSWLPIRGDLHVGVQHRHLFQIPKSIEFPFEAWLRGFYFWREKTIAIRPYYWPEGKYDWWDDSHHKLHTHVAFRLLDALRPSLPPTTQVLTSVDNKLLRGKFGHLALDW